MIVIRHHLYRPEIRKKNTFTEAEIPSLSTRSAAELEKTLKSVNKKIEKLKDEKHKLQEELELRSAVEQGMKLYELHTTSTDHHNGDIDDDWSWVMLKDKTDAGRALGALYAEELVSIKLVKDWKLKKGRKK